MPRSSAIGMVSTQRGKDDPELGRLLLVQSGATLFRAFIALFASVILWGLALLLLLSSQEISDGFAVVLIVAGTLFLLAFLFGYLKSVKCYERGVVVYNLWKSQSVPFSDIVAINYFAVHRYTNGIFNGTACQFEVIPRIEASIGIRILGSERDSNRLENMVEIILRSNPDAKLLKWNLD